jgi:hypothetical protein
VINSRKSIREERVASMGRKKNTYRISVEESDENRQLGIERLR